MLENLEQIFYLPFSRKSEIWLWQHGFDPLVHHYGIDQWVRKLTLGEPPQGFIVIVVARRTGEEWTVSYEVRPSEYHNMDAAVFRRAKVNPYNAYTSRRHKDVFDCFKEIQDEFLRVHGVFSNLQECQ